MLEQVRFYHDPSFFSLYLADRVLLTNQGYCKKVFKPSADAAATLPKNPVAQKRSSESKGEFARTSLIVPFGTAHLTRVERLDSCSIGNMVENNSVVRRWLTADCRPACQKYYPRRSITNPSLRHPSQRGLPASGNNAAEPIRVVPRGSACSTARSSGLQ